jgi:hypothetical protein
MSRKPPHGWCFGQKSHVGVVETRVQPTCEWSGLLLSTNLSGACWLIDIPWLRMPLDCVTISGPHPFLSHQCCQSGSDGFDASSSLALTSRLPINCIITVSSEILRAFQIESNRIGNSFCLGPRFSTFFRLDLAVSRSTTFRDSSSIQHHG